MHFLINKGKFVCADASIVGVSVALFSNDVLFIVFLCIVGENRDSACKGTSMD